MIKLIFEALKYIRIEDPPAYWKYSGYSNTAYGYTASNTPLTVSTPIGSNTISPQTSGNLTLTASSSTNLSIDYTWVMNSSQSTLSAAYPLPNGYKITLNSASLKGNNLVLNYSQSFTVESLDPFGLFNGLYLEPSETNMMLAKEILDLLRHNTIKEDKDIKATVLIINHTDGERKDILKILDFLEIKPEITVAILAELISQNKNLYVVRFTLPKLDITPKQYTTEGKTKPTHVTREYIDSAVFSMFITDKKPSWDAIKIGDNARIKNFCMPFSNLHPYFRIALTHALYTRKPKSQYCLKEIKNIRS